jgi:hypothetical protein
MLSITSGCDSKSSDQFELQQDKQGRTIRLNKATGEIAVLQGTELVAIKTPEQSRTSASVRVGLATAKEWPSVDLKTIAPGLMANLQTSWRDEKLYYQFTLSAVPKLNALINERSPLRSFEVLLTDPAGFNVVTIRVPLESLIREIDADGKAESYDANDSTPCAEDIYRSAVGWNVQWHL